MQTDLNYIYEVWRTGSFSQAAKKLFLSQPALSIAVRKYEQRMGMPIFDRSTQPLQLTPAGEIVLRHIFALQAEEKNLQTAIRDLQALDHGSLSLAATQYFSCYVLSDVLRQFHAQYPKVNVTIYEQNANTIDSLLMDGTADACFHSGTFDEKQCIGQIVFEDSLVLAVPADMLPGDGMPAALSGRAVAEGMLQDADCPQVPLSDFAGLPYIRLTLDNQLQERAQNIFADAGVAWANWLTAGQLETAWHMVQQGFGCTMITDTMAARCGSDAVRFFRIGHKDAHRSFYAVMRKGAYQSKFLKQFLQGIQK